METVHDIRRLIKANQKSNASPSLRLHAASILEPRESGSTTKIGLDQVPPSTPLEKVVHAHVRMGCECYRFTYPMGGRVGAIPFREAYAMTNGCVSFRNGRHGPELYIAGTQEDVEDEKPDDIYVIVGQHRCEDGTTEKAVFTWHPGEPLLPLEDGITDDTAVKVDFG